jgi:hypothetical protein
MAGMGSEVLALATPAMLPANYERARQALQETVDVDECYAWADKAAALASYAKQAKDDSLQKMAMRIHGRAVRRAGELLREIPPAPGERTDRPRYGTVPRFTRTQAAADAGLSERRRKTAIAIAGIGADEFESAIEADVPPTVTALKQMANKATREIRGIFGDTLNDEEAFRAAIQIRGIVADLLKVYERAPSAQRLVAAMTAIDRASLRRDFSALSPFLTDTMEALT